MQAIRYEMTIFVISWVFCVKNYWEVDFQVNYPINIIIFNIK